MTFTVLEAPAPITTPTSHRFAPVFRGKGYHKIGGIAVASGDIDGTPHRLGIQLERVAVANIVYRASQAPFEVTGGNKEAVTAVSAVAEATAMTGKCEIALKLPWPKDSGLDAAQAGAIAAVKAFLEVSDIVFDSTLKAVVAQALGTLVLPLDDTFGILNTRTGAFSTQLAGNPRWHILLWHTPGTQTLDLGEIGTIPQGKMPEGEQEIAKWLSEAAGEPETELGKVVWQAAQSEPNAWGVIGGRVPGEPVAVLLERNMSTAPPAAYRLKTTVATHTILGAVVPTFSLSAIYA